MKAVSLLSLAAFASAFVIPDEATQHDLRIQLEQSKQSVWGNIPGAAEKLWTDFEEGVIKTGACAKNKFDEVVDVAWETAIKYDEQFQTAFAGDAWLQEPAPEDDLVEHPPHDGHKGHKDHKGHHDDDHHDGPPHKGPGHGPPHKGPHDGPPHKGPGHGRPHHPTNLTVYQLIANSKYTTKLAKAISEYPDLVAALNGTKANYTVFAPTDKAFEKIPKHAPKPSKEQLKKILEYHVSPEFYPAGRVLTSRTIPTALKAQYIKDVPQRLSTQIGLRGLTVNFYARIIAIDIFGTNGVIHGIDSILLPPPKVVDIITFLPGEFSTLELALYKTGLFETLNDTSSHNGGTIFAPSNFAFRRLGPRINAFLFSKAGLKYLKALILYHVSDDVTLYSDAIYKTGEDSTGGGPHGPPHRIPKGLYHIDLKTGLEGKKLSVDIARFGRLITIKINAFTRVIVSDGIAADGVIHVIPNVLIPPKEPGQESRVLDESMSIEELKAAFDDHVTEEDYDFEL